MRMGLGVKKVELLAPCGNYECFLAAVNAGADAVYLGGRQFGARAYADNFSEEELIRVIHEAHLFGVRVYLTVNTLVKEGELRGLCSYIRPLYEAGLDGAIVQDMGVFSILKQNFPELSLHASTQMTITGAYGSAFLKEQGANRIVPARELTLEEIKAIKEKVDIEIECFIHGAMCYCYSGQCLFSSMVGGRSGNRGRCAGPCRLPYRVEGKEAYYLSLKDMNTLEMLPELIEAGIDSFKIEGRMKSPEYVAGVVSVYRKYIDKYYQYTHNKYIDVYNSCIHGGVHNDYIKDDRNKYAKTFLISEEDKKMLSDLYLRSETGNGYYDCERGVSMLTLHKPGYNGTKEALLEELRKNYVKELPKFPVKLYVRCKEGEALYGEVRFSQDEFPAKGCRLVREYLSGENLQTGRAPSGADRVTGRREPEGYCFSVTGSMVEKADKQAVTVEEIRRQMLKTGGSLFTVIECTVKLSGECFVPVKWLKELRRELLQKVYILYGERENDGVQERKSDSDFGDEEIQKGFLEDVKIESKAADEAMTFMVQTKEQFYVLHDMMQENFSALQECLVIDADLLLEEKEIQELLSGSSINWGVRCPAVIRKKDAAWLRTLQEFLEREKPKIVYAASIDVLSWLKGISYQGAIAGEASLYIWNREAVDFWGRELKRMTISPELSSREIRELCLAADKKENLEITVYGKTPLMVTANCIKLSAGRCDRDRGRYAEITDRLGNVFPVYTNCRHCYNVIYNYLPTSYEEDLWKLMQDGIRYFRVEFTTESGREARSVAQTFRQLLASELQGKEKGKALFMETTSGRLRKGVE